MKLFLSSILFSLSVLFSFADIPSISPTDAVMQAQLERSLWKKSIDNDVVRLVRAGLVSENTEIKNLAIANVLLHELSDHAELRNQSLPAQKPKSVEDFLQDLRSKEIEHGHSHGADNDAHELFQFVKSVNEIRSSKRVMSEEDLQELSFYHRSILEFALDDDAAAVDRILKTISASPIADSNAYALIDVLHTYVGDYEVPLFEALKTGSVDNNYGTILLLNALRPLGVVDEGYGDRVREIAEQYKTSPVPQVSRTAKDLLRQMNYHSNG